MRKILSGAITLALVALAMPAVCADDLLLQTVEIKTANPPPPEVRPPVSFLEEGKDYSGSREAGLGDAKPTWVQVGTNVKLPNPDSYYAVTHIAIEEKSDNPCRISLWGRMVDPRFRTAERKLAQFALRDCDIAKDLDRALSEAKKQINEEKELTGFGGHKNQFIRSLRVCIGGSLGGGVVDHREIKGLRVQPAEVAQFRSDAVEPQDDVHEATQKHCDAWSKWNTCPDGQILTGIVVYTLTKEFVALSVVCKGVSLRQRLAAPTKDRVGY